jgi:Uncharacterised nucleotidyltransferase
VTASTSDVTVDVPLEVRLHLGRAAVQTIADASAIDLLHIKGDAVDPTVRPSRNAGSDIDVMVRPDQVDAMDRALRDHGWELYSTFELGSPFGHAQTYLHRLWGYIDLHRRFPGIRLAPADAFARMWRSRVSIDFAGVPCPVPDVAAQSAILLLNAARGRAGAAHDLHRLWTDASPETRLMIEAEVDALDARLAWDAAVGDLERHRHDREYRLWRVVSRGGTRAEEWWARVVAQPTLGGRLAVIARLPLVNVPHLGHRLGHQPTRREIVLEFFARPARGLRESFARRPRRDATRPPG